MFDVWKTKAVLHVFNYWLPIDCIFFKLFQSSNMSAGNEQSLNLSVVIFFSFIYTNNYYWSLENTWSRIYTIYKIMRLLLRTGVIYCRARCDAPPRCGTSPWRSECRCAELVAAESFASVGHQMAAGSLPRPHRLYSGTELTFAFCSKVQRERTLLQSSS